MPREIEFRAWDKIKKEWVLKDVYFGIDGRILEKEYQGFLEPTDIFEVSQWTGLRDSNGVKVFEGDIIETDYGYNKLEKNRYKVWFEDGMYLVGACKLLFHVAHPKVIGNIYQNPDLLHQKTE